MALVPPLSSFGGARMPWYWTDDLANVLADTGQLSPRTAKTIATRPIAIRRPEVTVEAAAIGCLEDDEIPLAA